MHTFILKRLETGCEGTFGVFMRRGRLMYLTLEPEDRGNKPDVSCIPPGNYQCRRHESPGFGKTFMVTGVPGRSHILFHAGNTVEHTRGCILLGLGTGRVDGDRAIVNSRKAMGSFMDMMMNHKRFMLRIENFFENGAQE